MKLLSGLTNIATKKLIYERSDLLTTGLLILILAVFTLILRVAALDYKLHCIEEAFDEIEIKPTQEQLEKIIEILQEDNKEE